MPGNYPRLLVVPGGVAGQLQDLGGKIFHHSGHVDWCASTNSLGIVTFPNNIEDIMSRKVKPPEKPMDATDRELEASPAGARLSLSLNLTSLATARHC